MKNAVLEAEKRGRRITELRESANMSKREFARTLGISPAYVVYLENGQRSNGTVLDPSDHMLMMICHKFGVSYSWLKDGEGKRYSSLRQKLIADLVDMPDDQLPKVKDFFNSL